MATAVIAKVLLVNDAGAFLCLRRSMSDTNRAGGWDFPGGTMEPGESITDTLHREVYEETGLKLHDPFVVYGKSQTHDNGKPSLSILYIDFVSGQPDVTLSSEHDLAEWMTPEQFLQASNYLKHHEIITFIMGRKLFDPAHRHKARVTGRCLVRNSHNQILLLRRSATDKFFGGKWDLPGGRAEPTEDPGATALRETKEEAGIALADPPAVYTLTLARDDMAVTWVFFAGKAIDETVTLSWEHDAYQWIDFAKLPDYTDYEVLIRMHSFVTKHGELAA